MLSCSPVHASQITVDILQSIRRIITKRIVSMHFGSEMSTSDFVLKWGQKVRVQGHNEIQYAENSL